MKTAVLILAQGFEEVEALTPIDLLRRAGIDLKILALDSNPCKGARGVLVSCDDVLTEDHSAVDLFILPGGMGGATALRDSPLIQKIVKKRMDAGALIGAICAAPPLVLGSYGHLDGRRFTCYPGLEGESTGGEYLLEPVVKDGNLITSRGVGTAGLFSLALIEALLGQEKAQEIGQQTLIL